MRQRALEFREPSGPLNGLLYSWIHDLIYSPAPIQYLAQRQFQNGLTMTVLPVEEQTEQGAEEATSQPIAVNSCSQCAAQTWSRKICFAQTAEAV